MSPLGMSRANHANRMVLSPRGPASAKSRTPYLGSPLPAPSGGDLLGAAPPSSARPQQLYGGSSAPPPPVMSLREGARPENAER